MVDSTLEEVVVNQSLKKTRYIWLKNPDNLTEMQKETLGSLKDMNLKTVRAYNLKLSLQEFWSINERLLAEDYLKKWYFWATHSRLKPMIEVARIVYIRTRICYLKICVHLRFYNIHQHIL
ncbi:MAG: transposase [Methanosarcinales archaeon]|nr:transposase [Methanosarcinales archaeon]MCD4809953.1 transposase [Methanosarcinales archaeon]